MEYALVLMGKCVRANMRWNLGQTIPARAGDPTADKNTYQNTYTKTQHNTPYIIYQSPFCLQSLMLESYELLRVDFDSILLTIAIPYDGTRPYFVNLQATLTAKVGDPKDSNSNVATTTRSY
jgi:hypothetical protein